MQGWYLHQIRTATASTPTVTHPSPPSTCSLPAAQGGAKLLVAPRAQGPRVVAGLNTEGEVIRRVVAANNHCLFTSLGYVLEDHNRDAGLKLRQVIADVVKSDPETYNAVFLDQSNEDYVKFILNPESWGGAIELSILCKYYQTEIAAVDVQSLRTDVYGQGEGYPEARPTLAPMGRNDLTLLVINRLFTESCSSTMASTMVCTR
ncbi:OTU family cysteine protease [Acanthamoeba castellanii str. Neff]|uniref:Ubiquitin thioesterase OTU n=1 Tax=Acanthamoeba castellanii (strain ATCC 30010 / Neff) TaxID=1257118 RepID=L8H9U1_ACACF|nr:OTU family cysteine protease [Acanthamoeba castellanii str. Neff]ELR21955.1 OTU family cysteine protease [Acanthamoeba castellanii str. Neff]